MNVNDRMKKMEDRLDALERHGAPTADNTPAPDGADASEQVGGPPDSTQIESEADPVKPPAKSTGRGAR
jgi:hypothetical protein